jgi:kelch-like protein 17 (actinfilin)/kelch-like protein 20
MASVELWDPATGAWAALPPMAHARYAASGCMLPSGRFAVLGGSGEDEGLGIGREDAEAFDPVSRAWEPLPPMPRDMTGGAAVAVAGGLLAVGGVVLGGDDHADAMLFDEESGRWFMLPGRMPTGREAHGLTTIPAP